jgi:signal transduction histidine kinase
MIMNETDQLRQQLEKQEKLASLGLLSAGIAHELKNPLDFVINYSKVSTSLMEEMLALVEKKADQFSDDERDDLDDMASLLKDNLKKIAESGERAVSIVQGILLVSRGKENEYVPTDVCKIVKEYVHLSYHAMRANHPGFNSDIHEQYEEGLPLMMVIPQDLSRAVLNIMNNAFYAVWHRQQAEGEAYAPEVDVRVWMEDNQLKIRMADNGEGMTDEVKERLYENFFTTKPIGQGTGLGMSITRNIVEKKHGGKITFDSTPGEGTAFEFTIPAITNNQ